ncbi:MAG: CBS domain containing membrane protein [Candidatus Gottesmanbacteria bacterium GW2011_GWC2_39_8]|uniref:CBS domain containing membrane protein n=1 Tax=Candidatus Gottesmanbacteria bacterium GW2011_GWC2_39_8 TaxID=1618450 RepID=A0A0G0T832_9BACT|nr:MAG: CBS domain containing membrane protein [Candidatus Gottesmanbacteria bacterium GW2011_GWC2_39_8]
MKVRDLMKTKFISASSDTKFQDLWQIIFKKHFHAIPITDDKNKLVGVVSEEDLLVRLYPSYQDFLEEFKNINEFEEMEDNLPDLFKLEARDVMNKHIYTASSDTPALHALSQMMLHKVRTLPVVDDDEKIIGMISKGDIFDALFEKYIHVVKAIRKKK